MRTGALIALVLATGCGFDTGVSLFGGNASDGGPITSGDASPAQTDGMEGTDAAPTSTANVAHLPPSEWTGGDVDVHVTDDALIDTTGLTGYGLGNVLPLQATGQLAGPGVVILRVGSMTIEQSGKLELVGDRPLIVIASGPVEIEGLVTASAKLGLPGPGGAIGGTGLGAGSQGKHKSTRDGGGGGGGFGEPGAAGGTAVGAIESQSASGGEPGGTYLDANVDTLTGGSGGGADGLACSYPAGAGGGAIQIYSYDSIHVAETGAINAGGGGGGGGRYCQTGMSYSLGGGAGGGSGGVIYLQAPTIDIDGRLAANGGGGGGGAGDDDEGDSGQNGRITGKALGGDSGGNGSSAGGAGGFGATAPEPGEDEVSGFGNAGGGGGGPGRVVVSTRESLSLDPSRSSPAAHQTTY